MISEPRSEGLSSEDRDGRWERSNNVRRVADQPVAFPHRLTHQAKFTVLKIANATVGHVRGGRTGTGAKIAAVHHQHIHAVESQVAERANAIDPCAHDQHGDFRVCLKRCKDFFSIHRLSV
jgi:hypothetical protein